MNVDAYLRRINYSGSIEPNAETLRALQVAHLRTVPFENLSIHVDQAIVLEDESLYKKIVENKRGGFCYEANGLFASLLRALGFKVSMLAAGVAKRSELLNLNDGSALSEVEFGPVFDHMCLMVELEERWLADVGFGDSFIEPLLLDRRDDQVRGDERYRIVPLNDALILLRRKNGEDWNAEYRFDLQPHVYADYEEMCKFHQTSPDSHFTRGRICSLATEDGRVTLSDMRLITTHGSKRDEKTLTSQGEYDRVLRDRFGIAL